MLAAGVAGSRLLEDVEVTIKVGKDGSTFTSAIAFTMQGPDPDDGPAGPS